MNSNILIGWGRCDITPSGKVMLAGQMFNRLSEKVLDPLTVTALALEKDGEQVIMFSADLAGVRMPLMEKIREKVCAVTGLKAECITGSATHTHTAPQYGQIIPYEKRHESVQPFKGKGNNGIRVDEMRLRHPDFVDSEQYFDFLVERISSCAVEAWNSRKEGKISFGCGTAVVGENRRLVLREKGGVMYGAENDSELLHTEGHVDHTLNVLTTYTLQGDLTGMVVNLACPSQVGEAMSVVSADFWHDVRTEAAARWGKDIFVLGQCSAAGDISPHILLKRKADERMMLLRGQQKSPVEDWTWSKRAYHMEYALARRKEIARRIMCALEDVLPVIGKAAESSPVMKKSFRLLELPPRHITEEEAKSASETADTLEKRVGDDYSGSIPWNRGVVRRFHEKKPFVPMELHTLRLGDMAFASNSFELYLDYGDRIKGRSKALQTFLVQLSAGAGTYLPTARSGSKGYGSVPASSIVTVEGGEMLVDETVKSINELFED